MFFGNLQQRGNSLQLAALYYRSVATSAVISAGRYRFESVANL